MSGSNFDHELERLQRFFDLSMDLLCIAGADGYLKQVNSRFSQILGYDAEMLLMHPCLSFVHPDDRDRSELEVRRLLS